MKKLLFAAAVFMTVSTNAQHSLEKIWQSDSTLKGPEIPLLNLKEKVLYVTMADGSPMAKDGKGSIWKMGLDGKIIQPDWVSGLDAPKGMVEFKNQFFIADLSDVVVVDKKKASVVQRIPCDGARLLHNIAVDKNGIVYTSDMFGGKVYRVENGTATVWLENIRSVTGLLVAGDYLYISAGGSLLKADASKKITTVSEGMDGRLDGIVMVKENEFIISNYGGMVYYVYADGKNQVLLDTRSKKIPAVDISFDNKKNILYVATLAKNTVYAYQLK